MFGKAKRELMQNGQLGRGIVLGVTPMGGELQVNANPEEYRCAFDLMVYLDGSSPFQAKATAWVPVYEISQFVPNQSAVAVRVDPADHSKIAIDPKATPPEVQVGTPSGPGVFSAANVLATGTPCEVVLQSFTPVGIKSPSGVDMYDFTFTLMVGGTSPRLGGAVNPAPPEAATLMYPGSKLPAKFDPNHPEAVVIDWAAALSGVPASQGAVVTSSICPNCGAPVHAGTVVCTYCGTDTRSGATVS